MVKNFSLVFREGGHANSLGRAAEVIETVLNDKSRLNEVYACMFDDDAWVLMRASDAMEKICREHPKWLDPYIDKFIKELSGSTQASILWHLAQIYAQVELTDYQREFVINWLKTLISTKEVDWIVSANTMDTLAKFTDDGYLKKDDFINLLKIQESHKSRTISKRASKYLVFYTD